MGLQPLRSRTDGVENSFPTSGSGQSLILSPPMWVNKLTHAINMYINNSSWKRIAQYLNRLHVATQLTEREAWLSQEKKMGLSFIRHWVLSLTS